ncbi:MAG TPA: hypothetical protein VNF75_01375 [Candidatus Dormibacteraeota bacterium]|nr:hypothetical protein [Candidatus Dormibacteraeota bacterium]
MLRSRHLRSFSTWCVSLGALRVRILGLSGAVARAALQSHLRFDVADLTMGPVAGSSRCSSRIDDLRPNPRAE